MFSHQRIPDMQHAAHWSQGQNELTVTGLAQSNGSSANISSFLAPITIGNSRAVTLAAVTRAYTCKGIVHLNILHTARLDISHVGYICSRLC